MQNAEQVKGKEGLVLDKLLAEYNDATLKAKDLEITKKALADQIKEMCNVAGNYETRRFVLQISQVAGRTTVDSKLLQEKYEDVYKEVAKTGEPYIQIKKITKKEIQKVPLSKK